MVKLVSAPTMVFKKYFNSFYREGKWLKHKPDIPS
jgi:hypothetical protein